MLCLPIKCNMLLHQNSQIPGTFSASPRIHQQFSITVQLTSATVKSSTKNLESTENIAVCHKHCMYAAE